MWGFGGELRSNGIEGTIDTRVAKLTRSKGSRLRIRNNQNSVDLSDKNSRNNDNAVILIKKEEKTEQK